MCVLPPAAAAELLPAAQDTAEVRQSEKVQLNALLDEHVGCTGVSAFDRPDVPASVKVGAGQRAAPQVLRGPCCRRQQQAPAACARGWC
jgi:hypothetical protein